MSSRRSQDLVRRIRGLPVGEALKIVKFDGRKAGAVVGKTLKSAIANAENNAELSADNLYVKQAVVDRGPNARRYWPRSRGMARQIMRRFSHVRVTVSDTKAA